MSNVGSNAIIKQCKYGCGREIIFRGKGEHAGATGYYEVGTDVEHTYKRCERLRAEQDEMQTRLS